MAIVSAVGTCALPGGRSVTNATNPGCEKCKCDDIINTEMADANLTDLTSTDATRQGTNARTTINAGAAVESSTLQEEEAPTQGVGAGVDGKLLLQVSDIPL